MDKKRTAFQAYLSNLGDEKAAEIFNKTKRATASWRRGERFPRPAEAREITRKTGLQMEDLYP